mmetsp:Transcript_3481/g.12562  ORF Transcript_3481/g.12562 Transcript_3481/m.12562 type:complete len:322 (-) Transcript_3481:67-1032(-)
MATRNRTAGYIKLRDACRARSKSLYGGGEPDRTTTNLLAAAIEHSTPTGEASAAASAGAGGYRAGLVGLPPAWVDISDEVAADIERIRKKLGELSEIHAKVFLTTSFDDVNSDEHVVEVVTQEISRLFRKGEQKLKKLSAPGVGEEHSETDAKIRKNVQMSLAAELQQLSFAFRKKQKDYLNNLQHQREGDKSGALPVSFEQESGAVDSYDPGFTDQQMARMENSEAMVEEREREIQNIVTQLNDLAQVMRDLSVLVIDQGTILDRIDYNIEQTAEHVEKAVEELQKADKYQKNSRAFLCIIFLFCMVVLFALILIIKSAS